MRGNGVSRYVYVISSEMDVTKVGIADVPSHRLAQLRSHSPATVELFKTVKLPYRLAKEVEALCHKELDEFRKHGKWFYVDPDAAWKCVQKHADAVMKAHDIDHTERRRREDWLLAEMEDKVQRIENK